VYLNSFALYGLTAYYSATQSAEAFAAAQTLFKTLEDKVHDREHGGYVEFFNRQWRPITDPKESAYFGAIGTKTYNRQLHVLEARAELSPVWLDQYVRQRLVEM